MTRGKAPPTQEMEEVVMTAHPPHSRLVPAGRAPLASPYLKSELEVFPSCAKRAHLPT